MEIRMTTKKKEVGAAVSMVLLAVLMAALMVTGADGGAIKGHKIWGKIRAVNAGGPYLGLVVPNSFEMSPLLQSSAFVQRSDLPFLDIAGRRFRFGSVGKQKVIVVMTGLSMLNAGLATQLLVNLFDVDGVVHFGIAGNANPDFHVGDVTIPQFWAHTGLWNWQRYGNGVNDELALEANGDYTRKIGHLNFSDYDADKSVHGNFLNSVWFQPEEIFPVNGIPEVRQHAFWIPVDSHYFQLSQKLEGMILPRCVNSSSTTICLKRTPEVRRVAKGCAANAFIDNAAYREFLRSEFRVTPLDMESAAVALVCLQQRVPFIVFRALSDLAGGGSSESNEADQFGALAAENAVTVAVKFISLLSE